MKLPVKGMAGCWHFMRLHTDLFHADQVPLDRSGIHIFKVDPLLPAANVLQVGAKSLELLCLLHASSSRTHAPC